ncbi:hypothetical protein CISIN_1g035683mg [Citrus sinensis]|uniref:Uncharacterized protein n=1 Tax=Citrus sinensis TaxID=2711 RepID=A0A067E4G2_CITSI|nr:hypothetical protein CISIN_1g035683mg [Citrus sinensis]
MQADLHNILRLKKKKKFLPKFSLLSINKGDDRDNISEKMQALFTHLFVRFRLWQCWWSQKPSPGIGML